MILEPTGVARPRWRDLVGAYDRHMAGNAVVAFLFATTGPLVILLAVATQAGLSREDIASWIFGGYALGGVLSIAEQSPSQIPLPVADDRSG